MKIATLLFTYNRSYHTEQVITALRHSTVLPQKLFVFQDGLKEGADSCEWERVNSLIRGIDWCDREIIVSEYNKGLAASIVSGINNAFKEYDAVTVLEDDCVPAPNFIGFMQQCFEKYLKNKKVFSVSGYAYPVDLKEGEYDIYGCGRISSWGWGTWKDRWSGFEKDYELIRRMKQSERASRNLAMWGKGLEDMVVGNIRGTCDSWAVFWALYVISKEGICINPYVSLIKNIGLDGSGTHCDVTNQFDVKCVEEIKTEFCLPEKICIENMVTQKFTSLFGSYTAINVERNNKEDILVYGVGGFFLRNEKLLNQEYFITKFIDRYKKGYYAGKKIIKPEEVKNYEFKKLLIMLKDENEARKVFDDFVYKYGISCEKIVLGFERYH